MGIKPRPRVRKVLNIDDGVVFEWLGHNSGTCLSELECAFLSYIIAE